MLAMIMAVVSTAHITQDTAAKLAAGEFKDTLSYTPWHNAGWFIHIDDDFTRYADLPDDLAKLRTQDGMDQRWVSIGQTDLQTGIMALVRAVAQPTTF